MRRRAFTIAEVVVSIAILAVMGAIIVPNATAYLYRSGLQADADVLDSIGYARIEFTKAINLYPGKLSQLGTVISIGDSSICNGISPSTALSAFVAADTGQWAGSTAPGAGGHAGPYVSFPIPVSGLRLHIGVAKNQMRRTVANNAYGFMQVVIPEVRYSDALAFDAVVDGPDLPGPNRTDTAGTVRWATVPSGVRDTVTLTWNMGIRNNCTG